MPETLNLIDVYELEDRLFEVWLCGEIREEEELTLKELEFSAHGLTPIAAVREGERFVVPNPEKEPLIYFKPGTPEVSARMKRKAPVAAAVLLFVVLVAALDWFPIAVTAVAGAVAMVLLGTVPLARVYEAVDWKTLVLIAGMYPLGVALNQTGAADLMGEGILSLLGSFGPLAVLAGVTLLCMVLTQAIHNAAVAIIMTPLATNAAQLIGPDPRAFCVGVVVACSPAFLMPYGHPASYLVQEPGGYEAADYLKFGIGLNVLPLAVILVMIPVLWPL